MSILVIDSEIGSDIQLRSVFEEQGFVHIEIAKSVEAAKKILKEKENASGVDMVRLIIINGELSDGDGFELCREIRKTELGQYAYIMILVSSQNNPLAIDKARQSGANDFAVKPYNGPEFIKHLIVFAHSRAVLLIEDDPTVQQLVAALLYKKNMEVIVSNDGLKAYNMINTIVPPRLAIIDIGLPNMNGIKLVEHIRSKPLWRKTPLIMLTASSDSKDVTRSLGAGANDYIVKPFQIDSFLQRIAKYLPQEKS